MDVGRRERGRGGKRWRKDETKSRSLYITIPLNANDYENQM